MLSGSRGISIPREAVGKIRCSSEGLKRPQDVNAVHFVVLMAKNVKLVLKVFGHWTDRMKEEREENK